MNRLTIAAAFFLVMASAGCASRPSPSDPVTVLMTTSAGEIVIAVDLQRAPLSAADFLRYVDEGRYEGGAFYRVVRPDNDRNPAKIEVIQGGIVDDARALPPVPHETTEQTGILHRDGVVSLARAAVGTGSAGAFFICIGDQPALDFGGTRNPDGQGFAAFGRVIRGMDVVRKIQAMEARGAAPSVQMQGQILSEPVAILSARRE
jgi:peptidyl-prolyl cis-trans isomerase A (cyclophilin A)